MPLSSLPSLAQHSHSEAQADRLPLTAHFILKSSPFPQDFPSQIHIRTSNILTASTSALNGRAGINNTLVTLFIFLVLYALGLLSEP